MTVEPGQHSIHSSLLRVKPSATASDAQRFMGRCRYLDGLLVEAQTELEAAVLADDVVVAAAACRRVASLGWLLREAADKFERTP